LKRCPPPWSGSAGCFSFSTGPFWLCSSSSCLARLVAWRLDFFRDPWRIFDLLVVGVALLPATGNLSVLRALRILRVLRIIGMVPSLKRVVGGLVSALPGMGSIMLLLTLVFYVFSVMATKLYGDTLSGVVRLDPGLGLFAVPDHDAGKLVDGHRPAGDGGPSDGLGVLHPVHPCTTFTVLNLFIGIIVSAMQEEHEAEATADREAMASEQGEMLKELREIRKELRGAAASRARAPAFGIANSGTEMLGELQALRLVVRPRSCAVKCTEGRSSIRS
jgi:voltage-gated sodium channel